MKTKLSMTRREFIKTASLGLLSASTLDWRRIIEAMADTIRSREVNIIWFEAQDCAGDTTALIQATDPDLLDLLEESASLTGPVKLLFHETIMPEWGSSAIAILRRAIRGELDPYVLVLEGAIPPDESLGVPGSSILCYIGEEAGKKVSCLEWFRRLLRRAAVLVAVGTCAAYGGVVATRVINPLPGFEDPSYYEKLGLSPSPTGGIGVFPDPVRGFKGLIDLVDEARPFRNFAYKKCKPRGPLDPDCRPAIAVPGCPANGNAQLRVLANMVLWVKGRMPLPALDEYWRPVYIYGRTTHEQCPRAGSYAAGDFRKNPGDTDYRCLFAVGCKGPISNCPWNKVGWVNGVGGPTRTGGVCLGCTMPGFPDAYEGFYKPLHVSPKPRMEDLLVGLGVAAGIGTGLALASKRKDLGKKE